MALQPDQQRRRLRCPRLLQAKGIGAITDALLLPFVDQPACTRIERLDGDQRFAVTVERVKPVAMAGAADGQDVTGIDASTFDALTDDLDGIAPKFTQIALDVTGLRHGRPAILGGECQLAAFEVEEYGLDDGVAGIEAKNVFSHKPLPRRWSLSHSD
ncbi:protein of unknown function [Aminobacter niigataensis]|nr:protein of unknown function [Aminobacter niigataensis]